MSKHLDLDAALAEQESADEPLVVTLFGEDWELSGSVPAAVTLRIASWLEEGLVDENGELVEGTTLTAGQCLLLLRDMVPRPVLEDWFDQGLGTEAYANVVEHLMLAYREQMTVALGGAEGKARAPKGANRQTRRSATRKSSAAGTRSKRTSTASTKSTTSSES